MEKYTESAQELQRLEKLAILLDSRFRVPGTPIRFGMDSIVGLIPGVGDLVTIGPTVYVIAAGHRLGARKRTIVRMMANAGIDWLFGLVPIAGDIFDVAFKSNIRNIRLLQADLARQRQSSATRRSVMNFSR